MSTVFIAILLPTAVVSGCFYALVRAITAAPKTIAGDEGMFLGHVNFWMLFILFAFPLSIFFAWFIALKVTNRIVGPIDRITQEIQARLDGKKEGPIQLRPGDQLQDLMEQINRLLGKKK